MLAGTSPLAGRAPLAGMAAATVGTVVAVVAADAIRLGDGLRPIGSPGAGSTVIDSFAGTGSLGSHTPTPSGVGSWSPANGTGGAIVLDGLGFIVGDTTALSIYVAFVEATAPDQAISWTYAEGQSPAGIGVYGFGVRYDNSYVTDTGFFGLVYSDPFGGGSEWRIVKRESGAETVIGSAPAALSAGATYHVAFSAIGDPATLTLAVDGVPKVTASDSISSSPDNLYAAYMMPASSGEASFEGRLGSLSSGSAASGPYVAGISPESVTLIVGESWAWNQAGAITITISGPVAVSSGDALSFANASALSAAVRGLEAFAGVEAAGIAASLADRDRAAFADGRSAVTLAMASVDAFRASDRVGGVAGSIAGRDSLGGFETASLAASLASSDRFASAGSGGWEQILSDVPKASGDRIAFLESARIVVVVRDLDPMAFAGLGTLAIGVTAVDSGAFSGLAFAGVAPFPVLDSDSAGFGEDFDLWGFPSDSDPWTWRAVSQIVIGVSSLDAFAVSESAYLALHVTSRDAFGFFDEAAYSAFTATLNYRIYANDGDGGPIDYNSVVATTAGLSWTSGPLPASSDWWYGVRVFSLASGLEERNIDAAVHVIVDSARVDVTSRPEPPTSLRAVVLAGGMVRVEWSDKRPAGTSRATGYRVYQGVGAVDWTTPVADVSASEAYAGTFFTLLGPLADGVTYAFGVRAYNGAAEEQNESWTAATADATGPDAVGGFSIGLTSEA